MHIEHIAMYVTELEKAKDFFVNYFSATAGEGYYNKTTGFRSYFLQFDSGARLEIMRKPQMENPEKTMTRMGYSRIAFRVGSVEAVEIVQISRSHWRESAQGSLV